MFPLIWQEDGLAPLDFSLFELQFCRTVTYFLPCDGVHFIPASPGAAGAPAGGRPLADDEVPELWRAGFALLSKKKQPVVNSDGTILFLPIWNESNEVIAAAVLSGGGAPRYDEYSVEWLQERSRLISRELRRTKQWAFDLESGLLNGRYLREDISIVVNRLQRSDPNQEQAEEGYRALFLMEIFRKARKPGQASSDIARAGACLKSFFGNAVPIHHFGSGLFGMLWSSEDRSAFRKLGNALLSKLKRQNFGTVHIGIAPLPWDMDAQRGDDPLVVADSLLAEAWRSLKDAEGRGPFALCSETGEKAAHKLRSPSPPVSASLNRLWRGQSRFAVVVLHLDEADGGTDGFPKRVSSLVGEDGAIFPESNEEAYLYLLGMGEEQALAWLARFQEKMNRLTGATCSMGVACFPCPCFPSKAEVPVNARKALVHTAFLGPGSLTVFNGVSLNISGDLFYNEGDLTGAIKEYKRGLRLDPDNINLLNSLAVIYAQSNHYRVAIPLFNKVLSLDPLNFMALFNLGFAYVCSNELTSSVACFERAMAVDDRYFDLLLQLGRIYCRLGRYQDAVTVLRKAGQLGMGQGTVADAGRLPPAEFPGRRGVAVGDGLVFRYLGRAYQGIGRNREAIASLQKAIIYNPRDAETLSRLGVLYLMEKQGDEIALSFCQQALNIDDGKAGHWYRLARVQEGMRKWPESLVSLRHCLALERRHVKALLLMAELYGRLGKEKQAEQTYARVLRIDETNSIAAKAMQGRRK